MFASIDFLALRLMLLDLTTKENISPELKENAEELISRYLDNSINKNVK